ncbi:superoxide dismutase [Thiohalorhabdus sp.]|uniref:superoxide dismutase n=1 Tax=Thiohalorhabdus sp. TaxID=3094134 RepID=UPI002FC3DD64
MSVYSVREELKPSGLNGISDEQINDHWNLYVGYVNNVNALNNQLADMRGNGEGGTAAYTDRRRRFGFEYDGMVLHEYYFGNLKAGVDMNHDGPFGALVAESFGSVDAWAEDFKTCGKSRGIGWTITYYDPVTGQVNNHFIQHHEEGHISGFIPLVVMDCWEHAWMVDHGAGGRGAYIDAVVDNLNWGLIDERTKAAQEGKVLNRF